MSHYEHLIPGKTIEAPKGGSTHYDHLVPQKEKAPVTAVAPAPELAKASAPIPTDRMMLYPGKPPSVIERGKQFIRERTGLFEPPIYGQRYRGQQPIRDIGRMGAHYSAEYLTGLGLNIPDVIANKVSGSESLSAAVNQITGFQPDPREVTIGEAVQYVGGLKTAGRVAGTLVRRVAARQALKTMLGAGIQFGTREAAEQTARKITHNEPFDIEGIHFEAGIGVLFGAGEEGVRALAKFIRGVRSPRAIVLWEPPPGTRMTPAEHARWARIQARREASRAASAGGKEWQRVRAKYMGLDPLAEAAAPVARPVPNPAGPLARPDIGVGGGATFTPTVQPRAMVPLQPVPKPIPKPPVPAAPAAPAARQAWWATETTRQAADMGFTEGDQAAIAFLENRGAQVNVSGVPLEDWYSYKTPEGLLIQSDAEIVGKGGYPQLRKMADEWLASKQPAAPEAKGGKGVDTKRVAKLRDVADRMDDEIEAKLHPAIADQNVTARRARIASGMAEEGQRLQRIQALVRSIADATEAGTLPESLAGVTSKVDAETVLSQRYSPPWLRTSDITDALKALEGKPGVVQVRETLRGLPRYSDYGVQANTDAQVKALEGLVRSAKKHGHKVWNVGDITRGKRFWKLGIRSQAELDKARADAESLLKPVPKETTRAIKLREKEATLIGTKIEGFFPTPKTVAKQMIEEADIEEGMSVLEPSAGKGDLADVIAEESGIKPDVIEVSPTLQDILALKGYNQVGRDFLEHQGKYDRIIMNPPYEKGRDIDHVRHAYDVLKPGGRVVALMSEGSFFRSDKKSVAFREWLDDVGGSSEKLAPGSFTGKEAFRQTGVAARQVVIDKSQAPEKPPAKPTHREAGFVRIPQVREFEAIGQKIREAAERLANPEESDVGTVFKAIEQWRGESNLAGVYADWSYRSLKKVPGSQAQKALVTRWLDNPGQYQGDFDKLPLPLKGMGMALKADYEAMREVAQKNGLLESWVENYTPHLYHDHPKRVMQKLYPQGGKAGTKFRFAKQRVFATLDEARKAGLHPIEDPALLNAIYRKQLFRTIAGKNLVEGLKKLKRADGIPILMGRPKKPDRLRIWENEYRFVNVPGLNRFMYVGELEGGEAKLIKMPVKADPEVASILEQALAPWRPQSDLARAYMRARGLTKRIIMYNPMIHGWNIFSDVLDEMNFRPVGTFRAFVRGRRFYREQDPIVERATRAGLQIQAGHALSQELREQLYESPALAEINRPFRWLLRKSDDVLWNGLVRNAQLGLFESLTERIAAKHPNWSQEQVDRLVTTHINTQLGTLPHTWMAESLRNAASVALFARNWTLSNADLVVRAMTMGRKGFGVKALNSAQKTRLGLMNAEHLAKGIMGLLAFANLVQLGFLAITNKLKRQGTLDGAEEPLHTTFSNERGHWYDVDTGLENNRGQRVYLTPPLFRYIRDYIGYATEPGKTLYNKLEPLLKNSIEQIANYSVWQRQEIAKPGAPTWDRIKDRASYFVEAISPASVFAGRPGYKRTTFEKLIPFSGTWIRRGAPGGKFTQLLFQFRDEQGYKKQKIDQQIDERLQAGKFLEALDTMDEEQRYATNQGKAMRILQTVAPLNYYWKTTSQREKAQFLLWLQGQGYTINDLNAALEQERAAIELRGD